MLYFPDCFIVIRDAPRLVTGAPTLVASGPRCSLVHLKVLSGAPRCSQTSHNHSNDTSVAVIRDSSYSEGRPECCPRVWYSPDIDTSKFTLHFFSDILGGFQWLKYISLMWDAAPKSKNLPDDNSWLSKVWTEQSKNDHQTVAITRSHPILCTWSLFQLWAMYYCWWRRGLAI